MDVTGKRKPEFRRVQHTIVATIADVVSTGGDITLLCLSSPRGILVHGWGDVAHPKAVRILQKKSVQEPREAKLQ